MSDFNKPGQKTNIPNASNAQRPGTPNASKGPTQQGNKGNLQTNKPNMGGNAQTKDKDRR
jgi:hypothetical protein